ncbi:hypothetical protein IEO21_03474 [Rhodonia placenta]|uniref:Uncharacterized protein n=1 Tax=Rhodonia placenta TaxID=104341 RepID=A0A8H7P5T0_9APHY|nr:hypothetical protein IEO21_03474 [Postia placenta]
MSDESIPRYGKINLIGIWLQTILWAIKYATTLGSILYVVAMWVLRHRHKDAHRWILRTSSTAIYVCLTVNMATSVRQLLECFVYMSPPDIDGYWLDGSNPMSYIKTLMYITIIWRLYWVWDRDWRFCVLPVCARYGRTVCGYLAVHYLARGTLDIYAHDSESIGLAGWSLDLAMSVYMTGMIAARLLHLSRRRAEFNLLFGIRDMKNPYIVPLITIIESGVIYTVCLVIMLGILLKHSPLTVTSTYIGAQLVGFTPLLILVRVGFGVTQGIPRNLLQGRDEAVSIHPGHMFSSAPAATVHIATEHEIATDMISLSTRDEYVLQDMKLSGNLASRSEAKASVQSLVPVFNPPWSMKGSRNALIRSESQLLDYRTD